MYKHNLGKQASPLGRECKRILTLLHTVTRPWCQDNIEKHSVKGNVHCSKEKAGGHLWMLTLFMSAAEVARWRQAGNRLAFLLLTYDTIVSTDYHCLIVTQVTDVLLSNFGRLSIYLSIQEADLWITMNMYGYVTSYLLRLSLVVEKNGLYMIHFKN